MKEFEHRKKISYCCPEYTHQAAPAAIQASDSQAAAPWEFRSYYDLPCCLVAVKLVSELGFHSLAVVLVIDWKFTCQGSWATLQVALCDGQDFGACGFKSELEF